MRLRRGKVCATKKKCHPEFAGAISAFTRKSACFGDKKEGADVYIPLLVEVLSRGSVGAGSWTTFNIFALCYE